MLPVFPPELPHVAECRITYADRVLIPSIEGPKRARARVLDRIKVYDVSWEFSDAEYASFKAWWLDELFHGMSFCSVPLIGRGGIQHRRSKFLAPYQRSAIAGIGHRVSARLEITEMPPES